MTYRIKDVAEKMNISAHTIRFYDKQGLLPFLSRDKGGNRVFTESDLFMFKTICCLKDTGMKIKDIKVYVQDIMRGIDSIEERKNMLLKHKEAVLKQMESLSFNLKLIDEKLQVYTSPHAVDIVKEQIRIANGEKQGSSLISNSHNFIKTNDQI